MSGIDVSDLIGVPYKAGGRDKSGIDCYGLCVEVARRMGLALRDVEYAGDYDSSLSDETAPTLNVAETGKAEAGVLLDMDMGGLLHIGICINSREYIHATKAQGVRISRVASAPVKKMYRIV